MFERDYLMKMLADFVQAIVRSMDTAAKERNPYAAARSLETAIGNAVDMDASIFLALSPESMPGMLAISNIDEAGTEYLARSLALASVYNREAGADELADFRMQQAKAVAEAYGHDISDMEFDSTTTIEAAVSAMSNHLES